MDNSIVNKRRFLGSATMAGIGLAALVIDRPAHAQILESGIEPNSVLAKVKKGG